MTQTERISGIYKIQSNINPERCYIGSAIDVYQRWSIHRTRLKHGKHHCSKLQRHYNKYGEVDFSFSLLLGCDKEDLLKVEQYFLDSYNPFFNECKVAGNRLGTKISEETRKRMHHKHSVSKEGRENINKAIRLPESRNKARIRMLGDKNPQYGKHIYGEENHNFGRRDSKKVRKKKSIAGKKRWKNKKLKLVI